MEQKQCEECQANFNYEPNPNFPRKYCDSCSAMKKAAYKAKQQQTIPQAQNNQVKINAPQIAKHDLVIQRTEKPHSYEFGKAGARHKIYYEDVGELRMHIQLLKNAQLVEEEMSEFE